MGSVSHSRVDAYLSCKRKEFYGYHKKLTRIETSVGLALGTSIHRVLQALYSTVLAAGTGLEDQKAAYPDGVKAAWAEVEKIYAEGYEDSDKRAPLRLIIEKYLQREPFIDNDWSGDYRQWRILAVEMEFNLEWDPENEGRYPFVVDLIVQDPDGVVAVVDHKGLFDFYSYEATNLMPQIPKYIGALRGLGHTIGYGIYNMIRTRPDSKGDKLKKADLIAKLREVEPARIELYEEASGKPLEKALAKDIEILAEELGVQFYEGRALDDWAFAMDIQPSGQRVQRSFLEQIVASQEVAALDELDDETRDIKALRVGNNMICKSCSFKDLCSEELRGGNVALLMQTDYRIKDKRDQIEVTTEVEEV